MGAILLVTLGLMYAARGRYAGMPATQAAWRVAEEFICVFLFVGMLAAASTQVGVRYFLSDELSVPWTEELSRLLLVWGVLWGAVMLQREDDQIAMTAIFDLLPGGVQFPLRMLADVVSLGCLALLFWYGWQNAANLAGIQTTALGVSLAAFASVMPVLAVVMFVFTLATCIRRIRSRVRAIEPR
jgi:TRAP-type C4-dicarboxylate transport system permease small subunit